MSDRPPPDPFAARQAEKEAARARDAADLAAGRVSEQELFERNAHLARYLKGSRFPGKP